MHNIIFETDLNISISYDYLGNQVVTGEKASLENIKSLNGPQFLHVVTKKGHGYLPAEKDPNKLIQ